MIAARSQGPLCTRARLAVGAVLALALFALLGGLSGTQPSGVLVSRAQDDGARFVALQADMPPPVALRDAAGVPLHPKTFFRPPPPPPPPPPAEHMARRSRGLNETGPVGRIWDDDSRCFVHDDVSPPRCAPLFVIIGALKTGTTSMYSYLSKHPEVRVLGPMSEDEPDAVEPVARQESIRFKETGFFSKFARAREQRIVQYYPYFPLIKPGSQLVTGEGSVGYIFNAAVPRAIARWLPIGRYIALLRHPVERAFSRMQHTLLLHFSGVQRKEKGALSPTEAAFQLAALAMDAIAVPHVEYAGGCLDEYARERDYPALEACWRQRVSSVRTTVGKALQEARAQSRLLRETGALVSGIVEQHPIAQSVYAPQIAHWQHTTPAGSLLVVRSEDFFADPVAAMQTVAEHIGLSDFDWRPVVEVKYNVMRNAQGVVTLVPEQRRTPKPYAITPATRTLLEAFYAPHNAELARLLNDDKWLWRS